tara:strand:- start:385 stop:846 length:462 start_codon:yes stop_codon:yes gene_type:complete
VQINAVRRACSVLERADATVLFPGVLILVAKAHEEDRARARRARALEAPERRMRKVGAVDLPRKYPQTAIHVLHGSEKYLVEFHVRVVRAAQRALQRIESDATQRLHSPGRALRHPATLVIQKKRLRFHFFYILVFKILRICLICRLLTFASF